MMGSAAQNRIVMVKGIITVNHVRADQGMKHINIVHHHRGSLDVEVSKIGERHDNDAVVQGTKKDGANQSVANMKWVNMGVVQMEAGIFGG